MDSDSHRNPASAGPPKDPKDAVAEALYLEHLDAGEAGDFEDLCRLHPSQADALRALRKNFERVDAYFFGQSTVERPVAPVRLRAGQVVGDYELVEVLGQGGMGQVWEARQLSLGRSVALKVIHPDRVTDSLVEFFAREARAGGRLSHPGIVALYDHGEIDGLAWISMEMVKGARTLRDYLDRPLDHELDNEHYRRVAEFIANCAEALQTAHEAGVIHRDIKPQNILISPRDEPKIADFGLAKIADESALSITGNFAGTYAYMSPEQAMARRIEIDHRTDVFSLGVVMYEMLAGRRPFEGDSAAQLTEQVMSFDPPAVSELRSKVPRDLSVICQKALEKSPGRRYDSMADLAADLRRHLAHQPILARPVSRARKLQLWAMRHPTTSIASSVGFMALIAISILAFDIYRTSKSLEAKTFEAAESAKEALLNLDHALVVDDFLRKVLAAPSPFDMGADVTVLSLLDEARVDLDHGFEGMPEAKASLKAILGKSYLGLARFDQAFQLQMEAEEILLDKLGPESPETLSVQVDMVETLTALDRIEEAGELGERILEICRSALGPQHQRTIYAAIELARCRMSASRLEEAELMLREILEIAAKDPEQNEHHTLRVLGLLAHLMDRMARFDEALEIYEDLIPRREERYGERSFGAVWAVESLANHHELRGNSNEAEVMFRRAYELKEERFGKGHSETLHTATNLYRSIGSQGRWQEAEAGFAETLKGFNALYGPAHRSTQQSRGNLAWAIYRQGRNEESLAVYGELEETLREAELGDSEAAGSILTNYAVVLKAQDQLKRAEELIREAIEVRARVKGPGHPDTLSSMSTLAGLLAGQGKLKEAEELRRSILEGYQEVYADADHPLTCIALNNLGWLLRNRGELEEARELLEASVAARVRLDQDRSSEYSGALINLAIVCNDQGDLERSEVIYRKAVTLQEQLRGLSDWDMLWNKGEHGSVLVRLERMDEGLAVLAETARRAEAAFGSEDIRTARTQAMYGAALLGVEDFASAEPMLRQALETRRGGESVVGRQTILESMGALGRCLAKLEEYQEAEELLLEMHAELEGLTPRVRGLERWCVDQLVELYGSSGQVEEASYWREQR